MLPSIRYLDSFRCPSEKSVKSFKLGRVVLRPTSVNLHQIARLIDGDQLSRAAARLCSRGVAEPTPAVVEQVEALFPSAPPFSSPPAGPSFEVTTKEVRRAILIAPDGLAAGPSGLRVEYLRHCQNKVVVVDDPLWDVSTAFANKALAGDLPTEQRPYFCGGRLVPLVKKDGGLRPLVEGGWLRSLIAKLAANQMGAAASALLPLQVSVAEKGP